MELLFNINNDNLKIILCILLIFSLIILHLLASKWKKLKGFYIFIALIFNVIYIMWRITNTIPNFSKITLVLGILLMAAEVIDFLQGATFKLTLLKNYQIKFRSIKLFRKSPTVDILISTFNETEDILKTTIAACKNIDYPKDKLSIYICDDGHRENIKALCNTMEINYITRESNEHAKAGNLNNALKHTSGEFIMLLDADMIPKSYFLNRTLGYLSDKNVAFIQTPQVFYNSDPFQNNLKYYHDIPNEQDFFMRSIQEGRAVHNLVLHVGTNAIFRRSSIEEMGGFPTGTITEDLATGVILQGKGYESVFVNEPLAFGLSTDTFTDMVKQRKRWARGNIQVLKKWGPFKLKGLSLTQKLIYFSGILYWFCGLQKLLFILAPIIFLLTGVPFVATTIPDLLLFGVPSIVSSFLIFRYISENKRTLFWANIYEVALAPYLAKAAFMELIFSEQLDFNVTSKEKKVNEKNFNFKLALPHLFLLVLSISAIIMGSLKIYFNLYSLSSIIINLFWCCYNIVGIFISVLLCIERPKPEDEENVLIRDYIKVDNLMTQQTTTYNLHEMSLKNIVLYKNDYFISEDIKIGDMLIINHPELYGIQLEVNNLKESNNKLYIYGSFKDVDTIDYLKLVKYVFDNSRGYTIVDNEFISRY